MDDEQLELQLKLIEDTTNEMCKSKQSCIDFLKESGILDKNGNLSKRYGG